MTRGSGTPFNPESGGKKTQSTSHLDYATAATAPRVDRVSIASFVCGCALCVPLVAGLLAIIFGIVGMKRTRDVRVAGRGLAIAGLSLGIVNFVVYAGAILASMLDPRGPRETDNRVVCASHMRQIGQALKLYANENRGQYPDSLGPLLTTEDLTPFVMCCPSTEDTPATGDTVADIAANLETGGHLSYTYVRPDFGLLVPGDAVVLYEPLTNHHNDGIHVLFGDESVQFLSSKVAKDVIPQLKSGKNPPTWAHP